VAVGLVNMSALQIMGSKASAVRMHEIDSYSRTRALEEQEQWVFSS
jgi:hypothetical protein